MMLEKQEVLFKFIDYPDGHPDLVTTAENYTYSDGWED